MFFFPSFAFVLVKVWWLYEGPNETLWSLERDAHPPRHRVNAVIGWSTLSRIPVVLGHLPKYGFRWTPSVWWSYGFGGAASDWTGKCHFSKNPEILNVFGPKKKHYSATGVCRCVIRMDENSSAFFKDPLLTYSHTAVQLQHKSVWVREHTVGSFVLVWVCKRIS